MKSTDAQKKIAIINDMSGYGRCSLSVMLPIVSCLKAQACPLPTAILSNHTGFPSEYKYDFTDHMGPYMQAWEQLHIPFRLLFQPYDILLIIVGNIHIIPIQIRMDFRRPGTCHS